MIPTTSYRTAAVLHLQQHVRESMNVLPGLVRDLARQVGNPAASFAWKACPIQVSTIRGRMLIEGRADKPQDCRHGLQQALLCSGGRRRLPADT